MTSTRPGEGRQGRLLLRPHHTLVPGPSRRSTYPHWTLTPGVLLQVDWPLRQLTVRGRKLPRQVTLTRCAAGPSPVSGAAGGCSNVTVYVIGGVGSKAPRLVKIGFTAGDPQKRLLDLQVGCPYPLRVLWQSTPKHGLQSETKLHVLFDAYCVHGEWFDFGNANPIALIAAAIDLPPLPGYPLVSRRDIRTRVQPKPPQSKSASIQRPPELPPDTPRDLLADLDAVLGEHRIPAADVPPMLRHLASDWLPYQRMTGKSLRAELAKRGVKVPSTMNKWPVDPAAIRSAIAKRHPKAS